MDNSFTIIRSEPHPIPPADSRPASYEVRMRWTVGSTYCLIGHDRAGEAMLEVRVASSLPNRTIADLVDTVERWCRENDPPPQLRRVDNAPANRGQAVLANSDY